MKKYVTAKSVFAMLMMMLIMFASTSTAFASTNSNLQEVSEGEANAEVIEPRLNETVIRTFEASIPITFNATTTYQNPTMYVSVTDNYKSSNKYTVEVTTPNGGVYERVVTGNGVEPKFRFSSPGQYSIYSVIRTGTSINQKVTIKVRFANEL